MKIFITGATGFVGRPLVQRLLREGHEVLALVRDPARARALLGSQVKLLGTNETDQSLARDLEGCEAIINLAGAGVMDQRWTKARRGVLYNSRIDTTRRLVKLLDDLPARRPKALISASAVGYYGPSPDGVITESDRQGPGFLARLCGDWEHTASAASFRGVRVVQLRTGIVLGNGGGALASLVPLFRAGLGGRLGNGQQAMPWIHIHDVIEIIMASLVNETIEGPINIVSPHPVSNSEFTQELACALGKRSFLSVPGFALELALGKAASVLLGGQRAVPAALLRSGFQFRYPKLGPALHNLLSGDETLRIDRAAQHAASPYLQARGARYQLRQETVINAPLAEVFAFFSNAENLGLLTPAHLGFIIESPLPIQMRRGANIDYTIRVHGVPMRWQTEIESWQPGVAFVDSQTRGPYRSWWHEHSFRALGTQTIMHDRVFYSPPLGPLGWLAHRLKIRAMLTEIFRYRSKAIELHFASSSDPRGASSWPRVA